MKHRLILGTRRSALALWQANYVKCSLEKLHSNLEVILEEVVTRGDRILDASLPAIGGKGVFTAELEEGIRDLSFDCAVHSLKDLPTELDPKFSIGAIPSRASCRDVLISKDNAPLSKLPTGATVGSSSLRRSAQLKRVRPDLVFKDIRGNVDTRINKVRRGDFDATILAEAGLVRLGLEREIAYTFSPSEMLPAPGQGALAIQCRSDDSETLSLLSNLEHLPTRLTTTAERSFLRALNAGCSAPVAAFADLEGSTLTLSGRCFDNDLSASFEATESISLGKNQLDDAVKLGELLAHAVERKGFRVLR